MFRSARWCARPLCLLALWCVAVSVTVSDYWCCGVDAVPFALHAVNGTVTKHSSVHKTLDVPHKATPKKGTSPSRKNNTADAADSGAKGPGPASTLEHTRYPKQQHTETHTETHTQARGKIVLKESSATKNNSVAAAVKSGVNSTDSNPTLTGRVGEDLPPPPAPIRTLNKTEISAIVNASVADDEVSEDEINNGTLRVPVAFNDTEAEGHWPLADAPVPDLTLQDIGKKIPPEKRPAVKSVVEPRSGPIIDPSLELGQRHSKMQEPGKYTPKPSDINKAAASPRRSIAKRHLPPTQPDIREAKLTGKLPENVPERISKLLSKKRNNTVVPDTATAGVNVKVDETNSTIAVAKADSAVPLSNSTVSLPLFTCASNCSGHGKCVDQNDCDCDDGWCGASCEELSVCPKNCSGHGRCSCGDCFCLPDWSGDLCDVALVCPGNCSGHGWCTKGSCTCFPTFSGKNCSIGAETCNPPCKHGVCSNGFCLCDTKFTGPGCDIQVEVSEGCEGCDDDNGKCISGKCVCNNGWKGENCTDTRCLPSCSGHGKCVEAWNTTDEVCVCAPGWDGIDCTKPTLCPGNCTGHGVCFEGECACVEGWAGRNCSEDVRLCLHDCSGHGVCSPDPNEGCLCEDGWIGQDCGTVDMQCPNKCSGHGTCTANATCECIQDWGGEDCSIVFSCPSNCNYRGICHTETHLCECFAGYAGSACEETRTLKCPNDCSKQGTCKIGRCICNDGFAGVDCSKNVPCPHHCFFRGRCRDGQCQCNDGYTGISCEIALWPDK
eukprot:GFYU01012462.1.p1 GENE.GFYU01012462.1~~GFYU01012462.1.p1  ORF type:complete len:778 (-),score=99.59 GFYU01012462.1:93-2426(-)